MFADDSNLLICGNNLEELAKSLNKELENISDYFKANKLKLNASKTNMVFFRRKSLPSHYQHLNVYLDSVKLTLSEHAQFLGTAIDSTLNSLQKYCK